MLECEVCCGEGRYPVINRYGKELYTIRCPECMGDGEAPLDDEAFAQAQIDAVQKTKYAAAMEEKKRSTP